MFKDGTMFSEHLKTIKYEDLFDTKTVISKIKSFCPSTSGVYFYIIRKEAIRYPFEPSRIVYIGKSKNLKNRINTHFSIDMRDKLLGSDTLQWPYQNYFTKKSNIETDVVLLEHENYHKLELLLLGLFFIKHGTPPLCNGSVQRKMLPVVFEIFNQSNPEMRNEADKLLSTLG